MKWDELIQVGVIDRYFVLGLRTVSKKQMADINIALSKIHLIVNDYRLLCFLLLEHKGLADLLGVYNRFHINFKISDKRLKLRESRKWTEYLWILSYHN